MPLTCNNRRRRLTAACIKLGTICWVLLSGCGRVEPIVSYDVAKESFSPAPRAEDGSTLAETGAQRMLAALVPHGDQVWFFKLVAPVDTVAPHADAFRRFIASLRWEASGPAWDLPPGWQEEAGAGTRYATVTAADGLTVSVIALAAPQEVLANVNRWRGQLQLPPLSKDELSDAVEQIPVGGATATLIDFAGGGANVDPAGPSERPQTLPEGG